VDVEVIVGSSKLTVVSAGINVGVGLLDVGVSSSDVRVDIDTGVSVVWEAGRLQDDTPMSAVMTAIQKRFLMLSSFSPRIVLAGLLYCNSPSVFLKIIKHL
jgi:hypothetical protein